ncbi:hypothetical protein CAPI_03535 [Corynebacterium capitovis DSM 44611]|nr:hypothetical protein CAPI_03535 [Corynebacterium capitovis DSM 44611]
MHSFQRQRQRLVLADADADTQGGKAARDALPLHTVESVTVIRQPKGPSGCPSAIAPEVADAAKRL